MRINIGCGQTPTKGWRNFDNSWSLYLSKFPLLSKILRRLRLINRGQHEFIQFASEHCIEYGDASNGLPIPDENVAVLYSSHMLEHLGPNRADKFLSEAYRLLRPGGIIRIAVPDIAILVEQYMQSGDADVFVEATRLSALRTCSFVQRLKQLFSGPRDHLWMYDGRSLSSLLRKHGFTNCEIQKPGETKIMNPDTLDLHERISESVYVEAEKPTR